MLRKVGLASSVLVLAIDGFWLISSGDRRGPATKATLAANTGRKDIDPKRGRLWEGVHIVVDRTTRQWREDEANRKRLERDQHPELLVHIDMQEARFDVETSRLSADGPIEIHSEEAELHANPGTEALRLTWNQIDNRIDFLTLKYGGTMELRRDAGLVDFAMPGTEQ